MSLVTHSPAVIEVPLDADALRAVLLALPANRKLSLLDSCGVGGAAGAGRYLLAGFDPFEVIEARPEALLVSRGGAPQVMSGAGQDVFAVLAERLARHRTVGAASPFVAGGCIAALGYDLVHRYERLRVATGNARDAVELGPEATLAFYDTFVVHDYASGKTGVAGQDARRVRAVAELLIDAAAPANQRAADEVHAAGKLSSNFTRAEYVDAVRRIKEHIFAGDIYQANLTQQFVCELDARTAPPEIFERLRRHHPAPFAAYLVRGEDAVISASPERFWRVRHAGENERMIEAWPIKGTRPRGETAEEDARLRAELLASAKDRAENVMIVDLLRNDLGRVCHYGSIEVAGLCALEEHPSLFHLASRVTGRLREQVAADDILRATFPCGSITGAPKIRAMEIIHQIERRPRGTSMGAIGYFSFDGSCDLSVAIRTMTVRDHIARFNVGGGIVADSDPELEYEESLLKARALLRAIGAQERMKDEG